MICETIMLQEMKDLEENWDKKGAKAFSPELIRKTEEIVSILDYPAKVIPLPSGEIELLFQKDAEENLSVELSEKETARLLVFNDEGRIKEKVVKANKEDIKKAVHGFFKKRGGNEK